LHITPVLTIGGAEKKLFYILKKLDKNKFAHHVIYSIPGDLKKEIDKEGIPLTRIYPLRFVNPFSLFAIWRIYKFIKINKIDLVHCHLDIAYILGSIAAIIARVPVVFGFQNIADERYLSYYKVIKYIEKAISLFTDKIIVESKAVKNVLLSWGIKQEKLAIIPNGVEVPDNFKAVIDKSEDIIKELGLEGCFLVGNIARLVDFKNHRLLLNAAVKVVSIKPEVRFLIIGDGPLRGELEHLSNKLGISKNVIFLGTVMDFERYLQLFDIFVLCSYTESSPMALLHALAYGRPVISTSVGDIPSIIENGINGVLIPSNDPDALAAAIMDLLEADRKRREIAYAGWQLANEKFSIQTMIDGIEGIYLDVADKHVSKGKNI
jgi:glycosyltransferase involved in cell wall biosynthesis